ncbi:MAG: class I SAM-dependent methyltransferase [Thiohalocapsa sp.]|uniref:class I SAM-dependent methyltransferase n=1 Tax=Thiohalocapsa sp. TaxID=2497641 RepID=UPI002600D8ED|nr:class I SAM-dependent methyltransferase [Thiohalocapsa sp.]MCG6939974.1 class I SAM-dependent methyltransferase [Thiohalocapsa sp.]
MPLPPDLTRPSLVSAAQAPSLAEQADPQRLYERSVQCPEAEVDFLAATFHRLRGRDARHLREDFCGSAAVCCEWVRRHAGNTALGLDLDPAVLAWAAAHNLPALDADQRRRIRLCQTDVLTAPTDGGLDLVAAMNFSYWLFRERALLQAYFRSVHQALTADGVFFLDAYGGYDAFREIVEERTVEDDAGSFTYRWEQARYNPIDGSMDCHIHFAFADGSELRRAFSYRWRLWTLPEIRELLREAGFGHVVVYWQGWDEDGEPDGRFEPTEHADADAGWICYLSAEKG